MKRLLPILLLSVYGFYHQACAQEEVDLFEMSLEELMNVEIVSASQKEESLFDAPVSSYSITREEIVKAGITSIPEALRLCPGVVVRETSHGNYDIHIRGFDNLARYTETQYQSNLTTLVMIDNRPVFNYNLGGTIWEALPIDLMDVAQIEVVRGPAGPLFGPNAVTGVINIITRDHQSEQWYTSANVQYGTPNSLIGSAAIGKKLSERIQTSLSANFQQRERFQETYYVFDADAFVEDVSFFPRSEIAYANPKRSLERTGVNGWIDYQVNDNVNVQLDLGWQQSESQRPYLPANTTSLTTNTTQSRYVNLSGKFFRFNTRISHQRGTDEMYVGSFFADTRYDYYVTDIAVDYDAQISDKLTLKPRLSFQQNTYSDTEYVQQGGLPTFFNGGSPTNRTIAGSLQSDYRPIKNLRLLAAVRVDQFKVPDQAAWSYQFATTYKPTDKIIIRAVHAKSNSSAFVGPYQTNLLGLRLPGGEIGNYRGNPDLSLTQNVMTEVGVRFQPSQRLQLESSLFQQRIANLNNLLLVGQQLAGEQVILNFQSVNLPTEGIQHGITISANWLATDAIQIKPFVTFQQTEVENLHSNIIPDFSSVMDEEHEGTPTWYGGAFINWRAYPKLNINVSSYFMGDQQLYHFTDLERATNQGQIDAKWLVNANVAYQLLDQFRINASVRNLLGQKNQEFYGTDQVNRSFWIGISHNF